MSCNKHFLKAEEKNKKLMQDIDKRQKILGQVKNYYEYLKTLHIESSTAAALEKTRNTFNQIVCEQSADNFQISAKNDKVLFRQDVKAAPKDDELSS